VGCENTSRMKWLRGRARFVGFEVGVSGRALMCRVGGSVGFFTV